MADWRQNDSGKQGRKPKPAAKPAARATPAVPPAAAKKGKKGWRSKGKAAQQPATVLGNAPRTWTGSQSEEVQQVSSSVLGRWVLVIGLSVLAAAGIVALFVNAFMRPKPLPVIVLAADAYRSPELMSNPYAATQSSRLAEVNTNNVWAISTEDPGRGIASLASDQWLNQVPQVRGPAIRPGGPGGKVVAFYVNAFATFRGRDELFLLSPDDAPFESQQARDGGVALKVALENLASAVPPGSVAWVVLDLQLPPVVSNLGDLDRPWASATRAVIESMDAKLRERLLVTLPCDDGQRNWLAPECSASFFGYFVHELFAGRGVGKSMVSPMLRVGEFQELLGERTAYMVAKRRFAKQTPVWLPEENLEKAKSYGLVTVVRKTQANAIRALPSQEHYAAIDGLWQRLTNETHQQAFRWDPLGYATAESQLLGLEEIALFQPEDFGPAKDRVARAIDALKRPQVLLGVSLIEDRTRDRYFNLSQTIHDHDRVQQLAAYLTLQLTNQGKLPSFWAEEEANPVGTDSAEASPPAGDPAAQAERDAEPGESQLPGELRPELVWQLFANCAAGDYELWDSVFREDRLAAALIYAGQEQPLSLEMNLLKRLARDINWTLVRSHASPANGLNQPEAAPVCAQAVSLFDRLQTLATHPEGESSRWLAINLGPVEQQYMRGIDWLLANRFAEARAEFNAVASELESIEEDALAVVEMISQANRALYVAPHLLGWLLKEYPLAGRQEAARIESQLEMLASILDRTAGIYRFLEQEPQADLPTGMASMGSGIRTQLVELEDSFARYVAEETSINEEQRAASPLSYRREHIALLSPLTQPALRTALHRRAREFLDFDIDTDFEDKKQVLRAQLSTATAAEHFLDALQEDRSQWVSVAGGDVRLGLAERFPADQKPMAGSAVKIRAELLRTEYWLRAYASSFGSNPALHGRLATQDMKREGWPWTGAWQRWNLSAAFHRNYQITRLANASWGDGPFTNVSSGQQFLYYQLANRYPLPPELSLLEPVSQLAAELATQRQSVLDESLERLHGLSASFSDIGKVDVTQPQQLTPIQVLAPAWDAVANVFLTVNTRRQAWLQSDPSDASWAVDLSKASGPGNLSTKKFVDTTLWATPGVVPSGVVAIRGNTRSLPLDWQVSDVKLEPIVLKMDKPRPDGASLIVLAPDVLPTINVSLLIDCSASMDLEVQNLVEGGASAASKVKVFTEVKRNVKALVRELERIHGRDANVQLSVMPFGLTRAQAEQMQGFLFTRTDDLNVFRSKFSSLSAIWREDVETAIDGLGAGTDTPLYAAIVEACEVARARGGERTFVYVFSDGVNFINPPQSTKDNNGIQDNTSERDVVRAIQQDPHVFVSVFHLDYFQDWLNQQSFSAARKDEWINGVYKPGIASLFKLSTDLSQFRYYKSAEADVLLEDSLANLPSSRVKVYPKLDPDMPVAEANLDEPIKLPQGALPAQYLVRVSGELGDARTTLELLGGEQVKLQLKSNLQQLQHVVADFNRKNPPIRSSEQLASQAFVFPRLESLSLDNRLGLAIDFGKSNPDEFTYRPKFLVAEVTRRDDRSAAAIILADYWFTRDIGYPQAQLGFFPWPESRPDAIVRVWAADALPGLLQMKNFESGISVDKVPFSSPSFGGTQVSVEHKVDHLTVRVVYAKRPTLQQRVVVICPDCEQTLREFQQSQLSEAHHFKLPAESRGKKIQLQFATIADLEASRKSDLTEFVFRPIETK